MFCLKRITLTAILLPFFGFCQYENQNNRVSATLGGNTGFFGVEYNHLFKINNTTGINSGFGVGITEVSHYNFSIPLKYYYSFSENKRLEIGLAYTRFLKAPMKVDGNDENGQDLAFFLLEYNRNVFNSNLEYTIGITPIYEIHYDEYYFWMSFKISYLFKSKRFFYNPFRFKKRYNLNTT